MPAPEAYAARAGADPHAPARPVVPRWAPPAALLLTLVGLGLSAYTLVLHYQPQLAACTASLQGGCRATITGSSSRIFGVPVPVLGIIYFAVMTALVVPAAWHPAGLLAKARVAGVVIGIGMVIYLVYTELVTLSTFCEWCTAVHAVTFALFLVVTVATALAPPVTVEP